MMVMEGLNIYRSLEAVLNVLNKHQTNCDVKELLNIYQASVIHNRSQRQTDFSRKFPLIVFEGLDGCGKTTLSTKFGQQKQAKLLKTPPKELDNLRGAFDNNSSLRGAFYTLGNYIAANYIEIELQARPVILDRILLTITHTFSRFWHSTIAFALAQQIHDKADMTAAPNTNNNIYEWPQDLLKPDMVLYLTVCEHNRLQRVSQRVTTTQQESLLKTNDTFRENIHVAYTRMRDPVATIICSDPSPNRVIQAIIERTNHLFTD